MSHKSDTPEPGALDGIRVLDFTRVLAGPLCTMMLADLGAEVIKIEHPAGGDDTRQWEPPRVGELSAYFVSVNRNKYSITLNLKHPEGQQIARDLAAESHLLIENFKVGQMASFGLGYDDIHTLNPSLVYASITGFGQTGSYSTRPGYDYVVQAMSGLMSITGAVDGDPVKVGVAIADVIAGLSTATAVQAALRHADRTGEGQHVDIALLDTQIAALVNIASNYLVSGKNPPRYGNQHQNIVPYQTFEAADKKFVLAVGNDRQFRLMCHLIQAPHLADDPRFQDNPSRVAHRDELVSTLSGYFTKRPATEWVELLLDAGIPAGSINTVEEALNDAHVQARDMIQQIDLSSGETLRYVASPLKLSQTPPQYHTPPPAHGEHTDIILKTHLNLSDDDIKRLRENNVI